MDGAAAQHHQPGNMFIGLGAQRGTVATTRSECRGRWTAWRSLLGAPPLLVVELTKAEPSSSSTGTAGGVLTETAGEGGTQSMSTVTNQLSSSPSTMDTLEGGVGHPENGGRARVGASGRGSARGRREGPAGC